MCRWRSSAKWTPRDSLPSDRQKERDELYGLCLPHADTQLLPFHNSPVIQSRSETLSGGLGLRLVFMTRSRILPGGEEKEEKQ